MTTFDLLVALIIACAMAPTVLEVTRQVRRVWRRRRGRP
jgi:hypothetical protein